MFGDDLHRRVPMAMDGVDGLNTVGMWSKEPATFHAGETTIVDCVVIAPELYTSTVKPGATFELWDSGFFATGTILERFDNAWPQATEMQTRSVADIEGPWVEPSLNSGLIKRCRANWSVPVTEVSNHVLATFIRQRFALSLVMPEAKRRLAESFDDDTELYEGELATAVAEAPGASL